MFKQLYKYIGILLTALLITTIICSPAIARKKYNINTPSGLPEVTIKASKDEIMNYMLSRLVDQGYMLTDDKPHMAVFEKPMRKMGFKESMASYFYGGGSVANNRVVERTVMNFIENTDNTRVIYRYIKVYNPNTAAQWELDFSSERPEAAKHMLSDLQNLKAALEGTNDSLVSSSVKPVPNNDDKLAKQLETIENQPNIVETEPETKVVKKQ